MPEKKPTYMPESAQCRLLLAYLRGEAFKVPDDGDGSVTIALPGPRPLVVRIQQGLTADMPRWGDMTPAQRSFYGTHGLTYLDRFLRKHDAGRPTVNGYLHPALAPWGWVPSDEVIQVGLEEVNAQVAEVLKNLKKKEKND